MASFNPSDPASRRLFLKCIGGLGVSGAFSGTRQLFADAIEVKKYKRLGRTELMVSDVSFGGSSLRRGHEDLVRYAIDKGINYFDTADSYGRGVSETVIGKALSTGRDKVFIATKMHAGATDKQASMMKTLEGSLKRLRTDYIDIYLNHAVNDSARMKNPEWQEFTAKAKQQGKIRFTGMSGHAGHLVEALNYAVDEDLVDVILAAYNFGEDPAIYEKLTRSFDYVAKQPGLPDLLAKAKTKDVGVVVMKMMHGAELNDLSNYEFEHSTQVQTAIRWALSDPNVDAVILSMTSKVLIDELLGASGTGLPG